MRRDLTAALKARDRVATAALRSLAAALDNAEAVPTTTAVDGAAGSGGIAGGVAGLGASEADRRVLDADTIDAIVTAEITERTTAASAYRDAGAIDRADAVAAEADVLRRYRRDPL